MENPIKMDDLGGNTPIFGSTPIYWYVAMAALALIAACHIALSLIGKALSKKRSTWDTPGKHRNVIFLAAETHTEQKISHKKTSKGVF